MGNYLDKRLKFHTASRVGIETNQSLAGAMNVDGHIVTTAKVWAAPVTEFPVNSTALNTSTDVIATTEDLVAVFTRGINLEEVKIGDKVEGKDNVLVTSVVNENSNKTIVITETTKETLSDGSEETHTKISTLKISSLHNGHIWRNSDYPAVELYDTVEMSTVSFSDGTESGGKYQAYEILGADGLRVTDWVPPTAVIDSATGSPVAGFSGIAEAKDSTGAWTILQKSIKGDYAWALAKGNWEFICISGMLTFDPAYTPTSATMGYTGVRYTGFKYIGEYLDKTLENLEDKVADAVGGTVTNLEEKVDQEIADRIAGDIALDGKIATEATTRAEADTALSNRIAKFEGDATVDGSVASLIAAEASAREAADTALDGKIAAEASAREAADTALDGKIAAEASARTTAVNELTGRLDTIQSDDETVSGSIKKALKDAKEYTDERIASLGTPVNARGNWKPEDFDNKTITDYVIDNYDADDEDNPVNKGDMFYVAEVVSSTNDEGETVTTDVVAEYIFKEVVNEDKTISLVAERIGVEVNPAKFATVNYVLGQVASEQARAKEAEGELSDRITALETFEDGVDDSIAEAVANEASAREAADIELDGKITAETTARTTADTELDGKITAETTAREAVDTELDGKITAETTARTTAVNNLTGRITALETFKDGVDDSIEEAVANEAALRLAEDNTLSGRINDEASARSNADVALDNKITANATAISSETTRATTAEKAIAADIVAEKERAEGIEAGLEERLAAAELEISSLTNDEDGVAAQINDIREYFDGETSGLSSAIDAVSNDLSPLLEKEARVVLEETNDGQDGVTFDYYTYSALKYTQDVTDDKPEATVNVVLTGFSKVGESAILSFKNNAIAIEIGGSNIANGFKVRDAFSDLILSIVDITIRVTCTDIIIDNDNTQYVYSFEILDFSYTESNVE